MTAGRPHNCSRCAEIAFRYRDGQDSHTIAAVLGCASATVINSLRRHGEVVRSPYDARRAWHAEAVARAQRGESMANIAMAVGYTRERVRQVLLKTGTQAVRWPARPHRCGVPCGVLRDAPKPIRALRILAIETGVSTGRLSNALRHHPEIPRNTGRIHQCGELCLAVKRALDAGRTAHSAIVGMPNERSKAARVYGHIRICHPDWPWKQPRPPHQCKAWCPVVLEGLRLGLSGTKAVARAMPDAPFGTLASRAWYLSRVHAEWPWPKRKPRVIADGSKPA